MLSDGSDDEVHVTATRQVHNALLYMQNAPLLIDIYSAIVLIVTVLNLGSL